MATVQTLIDRALRMNGVLTAGSVANATDTADCLIAINAMIESWRNERLMVYAQTKFTLTLVAGTSSYTIGTGGDVNTTRPLKIEDAYQTLGTIDYPVEIISDIRWNQISDKATVSEIVQVLYYEPSLATGTLHVWPVPTAVYNVTLQVWEPLLAYTAATDTIALPPGYERALAYNLAVEIAPEYGEGLTGTVVEIARTSKAALKKTNRPSAEVLPEIGRLFGNRRSNIEAGE